MQQGSSAFLELMRSCVRLASLRPPLILIWFQRRVSGVVAGRSCLPSRDLFCFGARRDKEAPAAMLCFTLSLCYYYYHHHYRCSSGPGSMEGDDKWKLSKKGRSRSGRNYYYPDAGSSGAASGLSRSYSASVSATRDTAAGSSSSQQQQQQQSSSRLSKKCVEAVKEHRARFYIVRRCVSMLVCWRDY